MNVLGLPAPFGAVGKRDVPLHAAVGVAGPDRPGSRRYLVLEQLVGNLLERPALLAIPRAKLANLLASTLGTQPPSGAARPLA